MDDTRDYILSRVAHIAAQSDYVHISDDLTSVASYAHDTTGTYYEGSNILVRVEGADTDLVSAENAVLFSSHIDSVSTAAGATDDTISIAAMLQLVEYLSKPERRPRRTAVFLFNNGEEDGLNGAHMFFEHPWSNLTSTFVNLEGSGSGGYD